MAAKKEVSSMDIIPSPVSQPGAVDHSSFAITGHKLNGQNYLAWSQSVLSLYLEKVGEYLTNETVQHVENTSKLFDIECLLHDQRQGDLNVTQYFSIFNQYWQQLDMFEEHTWKCPDDALYHKKLVEQKRLYKFLIGLNKNLDNVHERILSQRPIPSLCEAFAEVHCEKSRKKVMLGKQGSFNHYDKPDDAKSTTWKDSRGFSGTTDGRRI